jgi:hypothetical protein
MIKLWLFWHELKHATLYKLSFKYRQAIRMIEMQEEKIEQLGKLGEKK